MKRCCHTLKLSGHYGECFHFLKNITVFNGVLPLLPCITRLPYLQNCCTEKNGHLAIFLPIGFIDTAFFNIIDLHKQLWDQIKY